MQCVVLCAGRGSRMGGEVPKVLLPIKGKPLVRHVVEMWEGLTDQFVFVLGYKGKDVREALPKDSIFVFQTEQRGIADAILKTEKFIRGDFVVALGDCIQKGTWQLPKVPIELGVGVWRAGQPKSIREGYSVQSDGTYISKVVEKPKKVNSDMYCGMGTYFFNSRIFNYIRATPVSPLRNEVEITHTIQLMVESGEKLIPIFFNGRYLNVTRPEDLQKAEELLS